MCVCVQHILAAERATRTLQMCNGFGLAFTRNDLWIEAQDIVTLAIADEAQRRASGEHIASRGTSWVVYAAAAQSVCNPPGTAGPTQTTSTLRACVEAYLWRVNLRNVWTKQAYGFVYGSMKPSFWCAANGSICMHRVAFACSWFDHVSAT